MRSLTNKVTVLHTKINVVRQIEQAVLHAVVSGQPVPQTEEEMKAMLLVVMSPAEYRRADRFVASEEVFEALSQWAQKMQLWKWAGSEWCLPFYPGHEGWNGDVNNFQAEAVR